MLEGGFGVLYFNELIHIQSIERCREFTAPLTEPGAVLRLSRPESFAPGFTVGLVTLALLNFRRKQIYAANTHTVPPTTRSGRACPCPLSPPPLRVWIV